MNELKKYVNKYLDYKGLLYYHKNLLNLLEEKWGKQKEEHNILDEYVDSYLNSVHYNNYDFNKSFIRSYAKGSHLGDKYIQFSITFSKNLTGHFVLIKSRLALDTVDIDTFNALEYAKDITDVNQITINNVIPNQKYYWVVYNNDLEILESGTVDPIGTRMFYTFPTAYNVRDLGGIPTSSGLQIKFGKLIRGSEYSSEDFQEFQELSPAGIFSKFYFLDLRNDGDMGYHFVVNYHNSPICTYANINKNISDYDKQMLADAINYVLDRIIEGHTIYFHCRWGAHRTGLLTSILLSLLDVPQCEIDKDYELTSFDKDYNADECLHRNNDVHGYKSGNEYIRDNYNSSWKNYAIQELGISEEKIEAFKDEIIIDYVREQNIVPVYFETTYKKLKNMKDRGVLTPGAHYRMIDYETIIGKVIEPTYSGGGQTVVDADSANHKFDLLLFATSKNTFDCKVKALHSARDTENYFANEDLSKWQLWYDIDNNKDKYNWASDNCKGIIYRMIDDKGNDVPYDFKNILFGDKLTFNNIATRLSYIDESDIYVSSVGSGHTVFKREESCVTIYSQSCYTCEIKLSRDAFITDSNSSINVVANNSEITFDCSLDYGGGRSKPLGVYYGSNTLTFSGFDLENFKHIFYLNQYAINARINITFSSSPAINIDFINFSKKASIRVENAYNNNVIKPYIIKNKQILNKNIFSLINSDDVVQNNFIDLNCDKNAFNGKMVNNRIGAYCSYNNFINCDNVKLTQANALDTISNCMNTTLEPYISEQNISNKGSVNSTVLYKHSNSTEEIITNG